MNLDISGDGRKSLWLRQGLLCLLVAGSISGGMLSSLLMRRGATVNLARKTAMLISGIFALPIILAAGRTGRQAPRLRQLRLL